MIRFIETRVSFQVAFVLLMPRLATSRLQRPRNGKVESVHAFRGS